MGGGEWDTTQLKTADGMTSHNKVKTDTLKAMELAITGS